MATTNTPSRTLSWSNPLGSIELLLTLPKYFNLVAGLLLLQESALNILIIHRVACESLNCDYWIIAEIWLQILRSTGRLICSKLPLS